MAKARKQKRKQAARKRAAPKTPKTRTTSYKGREIVYPDDRGRKKLFIDGRPVHWGRRA